MREHVNKNEVTVGELIEILNEQDENAIVVNRDGKNIKVYPGGENKQGGRKIIMIC